MLNPAGICLCGFRIHAGGNQTLGKETVLFVDLFRHFPAHIGQVQEIVAVLVRKPPSRRVATAWLTLGFDTSICRATSTERTVPFCIWSTKIASK